MDWSTVPVLLYRTTFERSSSSRQTRRSPDPVLVMPFGFQSFVANIVTTAFESGFIFTDLSAKSEYTTWLLCTHKNKPMQVMCTVRWWFPCRSNNFSSLECPPIHTLLSSVIARSYRRFFLFVNWKPTVYNRG